jgi:hypothetical protein
MYARTNTGNTTVTTAGRPITAQKPRVNALCGVKPPVLTRTRPAMRSARSSETGLVLAEDLGLDGLSVNAVVAAAGVSKGTFFHHFPDRVSYLLALHR